MPVVGLNVELLFINFRVKQQRKFESSSSLSHFFLNFIFTDTNKEL